MDQELVLEVSTAESRGVLGAFGQRVKSRYDWGNWLIEWRWDEARSTAVYKIRPYVAEAIEAAW